jgi:hypothetical protein
MEELRELLRIDFLQRLETGGGFERARDLVEQAFGDFRPEGFDKQPLGVFHTARNDIIAGQHQLKELFDHIIRHIGANALERGHLSGDILDFVLIQVFEQRARHFIAKRHTEDRRFACAGKTIERAPRRKYGLAGQGWRGRGRSRSRSRFCHSSIVPLARRLL